MKQKIYHIIIVLLIAVPGVAQQKEQCIQDILKLEEQIYLKKYLEGEKPVYIHYEIVTTDWQNKSITSKVKIYKGFNNMHFFSDQANIYQDEKDILMVLKTQKLIMRENSSEKLVNEKINDQMLFAKKQFLQSCELIKCENLATDKTLKIVELKAKDDMDGVLFIDEMTYTYNPTTNKLIKSTISYKKGYKVKTINIKYHQLDMASNYKFYKAPKYVVNKKGELLVKYAKFELIDNRTAE